MKRHTLIGFVIICCIAYLAFKPQLLLNLFSDDTYPPERFEVISEGITAKGDIKLTVRVDTDSLYYCPGALVERDGGNFVFTLVRAGIEEHPYVDIEAQSNKDGTISLSFPGKFSSLSLEDNIQLTDANGKSLGSWSKS